VGGEPADRGENLSRLRSGDLNGDGEADLVGTVSNWDYNYGGYSVMIRRGDGTFMPPQYTELRSALTQIELVDFDRDGRVDVYVPATGVARGNGDGTFKPMERFALSSSDFPLADFNGDGRLDTVTRSNVAGSSSSLDTYLGTGGPLPAGAHEVSAWFEDLAGNRSADSASTLVTVEAQEESEG
jgi:hypothetical protein